MLKEKSILVESVHIREINSPQGSIYFKTHEEVNL